MKEAKTRHDKILNLEIQIHSIKRKQENLEFQKRNLENKLYNLKRLEEAENNE